MDADTFSAIIDKWPSPSADTLAADLGTKPERVRKWRQRDSIPAEWWARVILAGQARNIVLTPEQLTDFASRRAPAPVPRETTEVATTDL